MVMPSATAPTASATWPSSCQRARRSNRSSIAPRIAATAPPRNSAATSGELRELGIGTHPASWLRYMNAPAVSRNAAETASPPPRGTATTLTRRGLGRSTILYRSTTARTTGVSTRAISAAATNATRIGPTALPSPGMNVIAAADAGWSGRDPGRGGHASVMRRAIPGPGSDRRSRGPRPRGGPGSPRRRAPRSR